MGGTVVDFLNYLRIEAGLAGNTILAYGRDLKSFLEYCEKKQIKTLEGLAAADIRDYQMLLTKKDRSETSLKRSLAAIRMFLRYCFVSGAGPGHRPRWQYWHKVLGWILEV